MYTSQDLAIAIKAVAKQKNAVIKTMLSECNLGNNTMSSLYHGKSIAFDSLARIADYLNCSVDLLLGRTEAISGENNIIALTDTEADLITIFRDLNDEGQYLVMQTIRSFKTTYKKRDHGSMVAENT